MVSAFEAMAEKREEPFGSSRLARAASRALNYLGGSGHCPVLGSGTHFCSQLKSESTSLPSRLVDADKSVPEAVQLKCCVFLLIASADFWHVSPDDHVA